MLLCRGKHLQEVTYKEICEFDYIPFSLKLKIPLWPFRHISDWKIPDNERHPVIERNHTTELAVISQNMRERRREKGEGS